MPPPPSDGRVTAAPPWCLPACKGGASSGGEKIRLAVIPNFSPPLDERNAHRKAMGGCARTVICTIGSSELKFIRHAAVPMTRTILSILAVVCLFGCEDKSGAERSLLEWKDPQGGAEVCVTERPVGIKQNTRLYVKRDGRDDSRVIDDDAIFSTIAFVRHDHWLLVVCRGVDEVWAGYDYNSRTLYGEYDCQKLPFTRWSGQGKVVAERKLNVGSASPANFPNGPATSK